MTEIAILLSCVYGWNYLKFDICNIPLKIIGFIFIILGIYHDYCAKRKSKLFEHAAENELVLRNWGFFVQELVLID